MRPFYIIFCGQTMHVRHVNVHSVHNNHLWTRDTPQCGCIKSISESGFGLESSGTIPHAPICYRIGCLLNDVMIFYKLFHWGGRRCASGLGQKLWSQHRQAQGHSAADVRHWLNLASRSNKLASSVAIQSELLWAPNALSPICRGINVQDSERIQSVLYRGTCYGLQTHSFHTV